MNTIKYKPKLQYKATLQYKILPTHPNKDQVVGGWNPNKVYEYSDTYTFYIENIDFECLNNFMKHDLALVAGGGYNTDGIKIVDFTVKKL